MSAIRHELTTFQNSYDWGKILYERDASNKKSPRNLLAEAPMFIVPKDDYLIMTIFLLAVYAPLSRR